MSTNFATRAGPWRGGVMFVALLLPGPGAVDGDPPAGSVVAQGLVELGAGSYAWNWVDREVTTTEAVTLPAPATGFLVATGEVAVVVTDPLDGAVLLTNGEGMHHSPDQAATMTAIALAESSGSSTTGVLGELTLVQADAGSGAFDPGAGWHDLQLSRRVLAAGESFKVPGDLPAFVVAAAATLVDGDGAVIDVDTSTVPGGGTLANSTDGAVAVMVATVGPVIDLDGPAATTTTATLAAAATTAAPVATAPPTTATETTIATSPPTTTAVTTTTGPPPTTTTVTSTTRPQPTTTVGGIATRTTTTVGSVTARTTAPPR